ncbi:INO80 complex subunit Ies4-domain-containing protein [Scheffersomyces xylosifermentans]|uniref:INO80 complex subunit Ies4-domain-containing protein n=1 Tax=Scheffersomyces xylosifermentans TaxID=1304137 RepID=UPI00315C4E5D
MAPPKRYWITIPLNPKFLAKLPDFPVPVSKTRLKKIAAEERKAAISASASAGGSKVSSPAPENSNSNNLNAGNGGAPGVISNFKINSGLKESSTSGLTMNSISNGLYALDKSGKPCRRWVKKTTQFKTFSGFKVKYVSYKHKDEPEKRNSISVINEEETPLPISASATPDVKSEA